MDGEMNAALAAGNRAPIAGYQAKHFIWEVAGKVATVTLNRPERLNALSPAMTAGLKAALERQQFLVKEMNHRVKNSLALVVGMLRLQARENSHPEFAQQLEDATLRVGAIARVHEQLYQSADVERFDVGRYIEAICKDLGASFGQCEIHVQAQAGIIISTDRAISSALIVNELVSNAAKHAYQGKGAGNVWVNIATTGVDSFTRL